MRVLVTGGTGFVGKEIVKQLHGGGHKVRLFVRPGKRTANLSQLGAEITEGDILEPASLVRAVAGVDAVINLAGIISESGSNTFHNVHAVGVSNLIAALKPTGRTRLIHMSALGARPQAASRYHQSKWEGEQSVRGGSVPWTIFRPSLIYGPGDLFVNRLARIIRLFHLAPVIGPGTNRFQPVSVSEVALAFVRALGESRTIAQTYDLAGPEPLTYLEIIKTIRDVLGTKAFICHLPLGLAWQLAKIAEVTFSLFHLAPPLNRDQITMLQEDNVGDPAPAREPLGLPCAISFEAGIRQFLQR